MHRPGNKESGPGVAPASRTSTCRTPNGFTLIEVIVVMAIIGLLLAIVVPALQKGRAASKSLVCASQLRQIGQAVGMYRDDNGDRGPFLRKIPNEDAVEMPPTPEQMVGSYLGTDFRVFLCPADDEPRRMDWFTWRTDSGQPRPWSDEARVPEDISYMWSEQLLRGFYERYPGGQGVEGRLLPAWQPISWSGVKNPQKWGILSEGSHVFNGWKWRTLSPDYFDCRLDQRHYEMDKVPRVNMLLATGNVILIACDEESLRSVSSDPYGLDPWW